MKKGYLLLFVLLACSLMAAGYSDSGVIEKQSIQLDQDFQFELNIQSEEKVTVLPVADFSAELPTELFIFAPDLGTRKPNKSSVSEKLAAGFYISVRPPPDKVEKSEFNNRNWPT